MATGILREIRYNSLVVQILPFKLRCAQVQPKNTFVLTIILVCLVQTWSASSAHAFASKTRILRELSKVNEKINRLESEIRSAQRKLPSLIKEETLAKEKYSASRLALNNAVKDEFKLTRDLTAKFRADFDYQKTHDAMVKAREEVQKARVKMVAILNAIPEYKDAIAARDKARFAAKKAATAQPPDPKARLAAAKKLAEVSAEVTKIENSVLSRSPNYVAAEKKAKDVTRLLAKITAQVNDQLKADPTRRNAVEKTKSARMTYAMQQRAYNLARSKTSSTKSGISRNSQRIRSLKAQRRSLEARLRR